MQRESRKVTVTEDYILYMDRRNFTNAGKREPHHGTDHRMIYAVQQGEGCYVTITTVRGGHAGRYIQRKSYPRPKGEQL